MLVVSTTITTHRVDILQHKDGQCPQEPLAVLIVLFGAQSFEQQFFEMRIQLLLIVAVAVVNRQP
jgi:hypothetical protein